MSLISEPSFFSKTMGSIGPRLHCSRTSWQQVSHCLQHKGRVALPITHDVVLQIAQSGQPMGDYPLPCLPASMVNLEAVFSSRGKHMEWCICPDLLKTQSTPGSPQ